MRSCPRTSSPASVESVQVARGRRPQQLERQRVQVLEDAVISRARKRRVEGSILLGELIVALDRGPLASQNRVQLLDGLGRGSQRRVARHAGLEQLAHLDHLAELALAAQDDRRQRRNEELRLGAADERSAALTALDHALHLQGAQCLSYRRSADSKALGELAFGWDLVPRGPSSHR